MFNYQKYTTIFNKSFFKDRLVRFFLLASFLINASIWAILGWGVRYYPESMPLHYNIYFGPDLFGPWYQILFIPGLGLCLLLLDFLFALYFFKKNGLLSYLLIGFALWAQIFLLTASSLIIYLNY
jgi:hypothetical protein